MKEEIEREFLKKIPQYNTKYVRIGYWESDFENSKTEIAEYRKKRKNKELSIQLTSTPLFVQILTEITLKCDGHLKYGDVVQFYSEGAVLNVFVETKDFRNHESMYEGCQVTTGLITTPCIKNCFMITDPWSNKKSGEDLNYGNSFALTTVDEPGVARLYVGSDYPFGTLSSTPGHSKLTMFSTPHQLCRLAIEADINDSSELYLLEDTPIDLKQPFNIVSAATRQKMVLNKESHLLSVLGSEKQVSLYYEPDWFTKFDETKLSHLWTVKYTNAID